MGGGDEKITTKTGEKCGEGEKRGRGLKTGCGVPWGRSTNSFGGRDLTNGGGLRRAR